MSTLEYHILYDEFQYLVILYSCYMAGFSCERDLISMEPYGKNKDRINTRGEKSYFNIYLKNTTSSFHIYFLQKIKNLRAL